MVCHALEEKLADGSRWGGSTPVSRLLLCYSTLHVASHTSACAVCVCLCVCVCMFFFPPLLHVCLYVRVHVVFHLSRCTRNLFQLSFSLLLGEKTVAHKPISNRLHALCESVEASVKLVTCFTATPFLSSFLTSPLLSVRSIWNFFCEFFLLSALGPFAFFLHKFILTSTPFILYLLFVCTATSPPATLLVCSLGSSRRSC